MVDLVGLKVPNAMRAVVEEIVGVTEAVCLAVLDEEYADLARQMVAKLARKWPSPLTAGRRVTWAAGVVYALGQANFLFDPASQPRVTADQLSEAFGVAKNTMAAKARQVRDLLRISPLSIEFQRADVVAQNPMVWIISVNGLAVDARYVPLDIQEEAFDCGLIPLHTGARPRWHSGPCRGTGMAGGGQGRRGAAGAARFAGALRRAETSTRQVLSASIFPAIR